MIKGFSRRKLALSLGLLISSAIVLSGCTPSVNTLDIPGKLARLKSLLNAAVNLSPLASPRQYQTTTLLDNGKILVIGGMNNTGALASVEIYDPATDAWTTKSPLQTARFFHSANLLPSGDVLVAGGSGMGGTTLSSAEIYNPTTDTWTTVNALANARTGHTATLLNSGKVIAAGGDNTGGYLSSVEIFDPTTGNWTSAAPLSVAHKLHTATLLEDGTVLIVGGMNAGGPLSTIEIYDPDSNTWNTKTKIANARHSHTSTLLHSGEVLVAGGVDTSYTSTDSVELYDPSNDSWSNQTPLIEARSNQSATLLPDGNVLIIGGFSKSGTPLSSVEVENPTLNNSTSLQPLDTPRAFPTVVVLPTGTVVIIGGVGEAPPATPDGSSTIIPLNTVVEYDPTVNATWVAVTSPDPNTISYSNLANNMAYTVAGTCSEIDSEVNVAATDGTTTIKATPKCLGTHTWSTTMDLSALMDTTITLSASFFGSISNIPQASGTFIKDTAVPTEPTNLTGPAIGNIDTPAILVNGVISGNEVAIYSSFTCDISTLKGVATASGSSVAITSSKISSDTTYYATQSDAAGNISACSTANFALILDITPPTVAITSPADNFEINLSNLTSFLVGGTCEDDHLPVIVTITVSGANGGIVSDTAVCADGAWTKTLDLTTLANGDITLTADATDAATNSAIQDSHPLTKDTTPAITGDWIVKQSLADARTHSTATLLMDGKVLVIGGYGNAGILDSVELYDPTNDTWITKNQLTDARFGHTATLLNNGKVLVVGGRNNSGDTLDSVEIFDPMLNSWENMASLSDPRFFHTTTLLFDGKVIIVGGYDLYGLPLNSVEIYNPENDSWTTRASLPVARADHTATLLKDGAVIVVGGVNDNFDYLAAIEIYNPTDNSWSSKALLEDARAYHSTTLLNDGKILVIGGRNNNGGLNSVELYDTIADTWTTKTPITNLRSWHTATRMSDGKILVAGGSAGKRPMASAEIYDTTLDIWTTKPDLYFARSNHSATLLPGGNVFVVGGNVSGGFTSNVEIYDPNATPGLRAPTKLTGSSITNNSTPEITVIGVTAGSEVSIFSGSDCDISSLMGTQIATDSSVTVVSGTISGDTTYYANQADPDTGIASACSTANFSVIYDIVSPVIEITTPADGFNIDNSNVTAFEVSGTCEDNYYPVFVFVTVTGSNGGTVTMSDIPCDSGTWTTTLDLSPTVNGDVTIDASATDSAKNGANAVAQEAAKNTEWTTKVPLSEARNLQTATLLNNGKVLVVGGYGNSGGSLSSVEEYTPDHNSWTIKTPLTDARYLHTATLLSDGKVLVTGGYGASSDLTSVELYDPTNDTWTTKTPLTVAREQHTATLLADGKVLIVGGWGTPRGILASVELYDPTNDTWMTQTPLSDARRLHTATLLSDGKVLVVGGEDASRGASTSVELYDPTNNAWTTKTPLTDSRYYHTSTLLPDGKVLVVGGFENPDYRASVEIYNPVNNTWTTKAPLSHARFSPTATLLNNGKVLVAGGYSSNGYFKLVELYDPNKNEWTTIAPLTQARTNHTATLLNDGKVLVVGGQNNSGWLTSAEMYDPNASVNTDCVISAFTSDANVLGVGASTILHWSTSYCPAGSIDHGIGDISPINEGSVSTGPINENTTFTFSIEPLPPEETILSEFSDSSNGVYPQGGLLLSGNRFYATTQQGGSDNIGTIFGINTDGSNKTVLHHFSGSPLDGSIPHGDLIASPDGNTLYGMTTQGGPANMGTIFSVGIDGSNYTILHYFAGGAEDGMTAYGSLTRSADGNTLYGMTFAGGSNNNGTIFRIDADGSNETILHHFNLGSNGGYPYGGLILSDNKLYGTTLSGGSSNFGTVFSINTDGSEHTILHAFTGGTDGANPTGNLLLSRNTLFGTTSNGGGTGVNGQGTVFSIGTDGSNETIIYSFTGDADGANPSSNLVLSADGSKLFGTTMIGGSGSGAGSIFRINLSNSSKTTLYSFTTGWDGFYPRGSPVLYGDSLYGLTNNGGHGNGGILYRVGPVESSLPAQTAQVTVNVIESLTRPTSLTGTSPTNDSTPDITVQGVTAGNEVAIYSESTCDISTLMGVETASDSFVTITSSAISNDITYYANQTDAATGAVSACSTASFSLIYDIAPPTIAITSPTDNFEINSSNLTSFAVGGTCEDDHLPITVTITVTGANGGTVSDTANCSDGTWTKTLDLTALANGDITLTADASDGINAATQDSHPLTKNTEPPVTFNPSNLRISAAPGFTLFPDPYDHQHPIHARQGHTASMLSTGKILFVGGASNGSDAEIYDPTSKDWSVAGTLAVARTYHTASVLLDGRVLVVGGDAPDGNPVSSAEIFDPVSNAWSATESLSTVRTNHTASVLPSGKVLVVGGRDNRTGDFSSAEIYDPASGTWSAASSLTERRSYHTASVLPSGKVLIVGGESARISAEVYDPNSNSWNTTGPLIAGRAQHAASVLLDGRVLIVGGNGNSGNLAEIYDPISNAWSAAESLTTTDSFRPYLTATTLPSGQVLVTGGFNSGFSQPLSIADLYDPASNSWSATGSLNKARALHTTILLSNGKVLASGGYDGTWQLNKGAEIYDPSSESWNEILPLTYARTYHTANVLSSGKVLVAGGFDSSGGIQSSVEIYDHASSSWSRAAPLIEARGYHTASVLSSDKVLVVGGSGSSGLLSSAEIYNPTTNSWSSAGSLTSGRAFHTASVLPSGKVLVVGGGDELGPLSSAEVYDPATNSWSDTGPLAFGRYNHAVSVLSTGNVLVTGGFDSSWEITSSAEIYDPATNSWSLAESLTNARINHTSSVLSSGKVLIVGGEDNSSVLSSVEVYDPSTNGWSLAESLPIGHSYHTASILPSGKILIAGGYGGDDWTNIAEAKIFDPTSNSWSSGGTLTHPRTNHTASVLLDGSVLIHAGSGASGTLYQPEIYSTFPSITLNPTGGITPYTFLILSGGGTLYEELSVYLPAEDFVSAQIRATSADGTSNDVLTIENESPVSLDTPSTLTGTSPTNDSTPDITVQGVTAGNEVAIYSESTCDISTLMGVETASSTSITITSSAISNDTTYYATQTDAATGTVSACSSASFSLIYDIAPPTIAITSPTDNFEINSSNLTSFTVSGTCEDDHLPITVTITVTGANGGTVSDTANCAGGTWTKTLDLTVLADGDITLTADASDAAANLAVQDSHPLIKNTSGTWSTGDSLTIGRFSHPAIKLGNGKVLLIGGQNTSGYLSSVEEYDPSSNDWSTKASLTESRSAHTSTLLKNGKILVVAGAGDSSVLTSVELYQPSTNTWSTKTPLANSRYYHTATLLNDGRVLVIGGYAGMGYTESVEVYDPALDTWTTKPPLTNLRYYHTATLLNDGKVLVTGGYSNGSPSDSVEIYDPNNDTWAAKASLAVPRSGHSATLLSDGKVLVVGGNADGNPTDSVEAYDPATDTWTSKNSLAEARYIHTATLLNDGKVLVVGGANAYGNLSSVETYNPNDNSWTTETPLDVARSYHSATLLDDGNILAVGGLDLFTGQAISSAEIFGPTAAFSPAGIGSLAFWIDANDYSTLFENSDCASSPISKSTVSGTTVGCWKDKSKNSNHLNVVSGAASTYQYGTIGGKNALRFGESGVSGLTSTNSTLSFTNYTFFIVSNVQTTPPSNSHYINGDTNYTTLFLFNAGNIDQIYSTGSGFWNLYQGGVFPTSVPSNGKQLITVLNSEGAGYFGANGLESTPFTGLPNDPVSGNIKVGAHYDSLVQYGINGDIAEIVVYSRALNVDQIAQVQTYLNQKYDLFTIESGSSPLTITINSGPDDTTTITTDDTATFTFSTSDDSNVTQITCALDDAAPSACTSPVSYSDLPEGTHTVTITVTDSSNNPTSTTQTFTVVAASGSGSTPVVSKWTNLSTPLNGSAPAARFNTSVVEISGKLYVFGGGDANVNFLNDLHEYDPATQTWADLSSPSSGTPPSARYAHAAASINEKMYVFGGFDGNPLNDLYSYEPATQTWTDLSTPTSGIPPHVRHSHTLTAVSGKLYVFGGDIDYDANDLHEYDPATQTWTDLSTPAAGTPPSGRRAHGAAEAGGKLYIFDGFVALNDLHSYDPATQTWTDLSTPASGSPPPGRYANMGSVDGKLFVFAGTNTIEALDDLYSYDPGTQSWTNYPKVSGAVWPSPRAAGAAVGAGGKFYIFGGGASGTIINELYSFSTTPEQYVYVANYNSGTVDQYKVGTDGTLQPLSNGTISLQWGAYSITVAPNGQYAYVSTLSGSIFQYSIDANGALQPLYPENIGSNDDSRGVTLTPNGKWLYVANPNAQQISQFAVGGDGTLTPLDPNTIGAGGYADNVGISPDGKYLYSTGAQSDFVYQYSIDDNTGLLSPLDPPYVAVTQSGSSHMLVSADGKYAYVANGANPGNNTISQYSIQSDGTLNPLNPSFATAGEMPYGIALSPDGKWAYSANYADHTVSQFSVGLDGTLSPLSPASVDAGTNPGFIQVSPDGKWVYSTNNGEGTVSQFSVASDGTLTPLSPAAVMAGAAPSGIVIFQDTRSPDSISIPAPTSLTGNSPTNNGNPEITVSGVINGYEVGIYSDSSCDVSTLMGTGTASGTSATITSNSIVNDTTYYATQTNLITGIRSACSTANFPLILDVTPPSVNITDPIDNFVIDDYNFSTFTVSGSCFDDHYPVSVTVTATDGSGGVVTQTVTCGESMNWSMAMDLTSLTNGGITLSAEITDGATNSGTTDTRALVKTLCDPGSSPVGGGTGTEEDPYLICSVSHLQGVTEGYSYELTTDLNLNGIELGIFLNGNFDGKDHVLSNFSSPYGISTGLFNQASGTIHHLILSDFNLDQLQNWNNNVGALVGYNSATIHDVLVLNSHISAYSQVGGLVGYNEGSISRSQVTGGLINGDTYIGGLVGYNGPNGSITTSSSSASVEGDYGVGGLLGNNEGLVTDSYTKGSVTVVPYNSWSGLVGGLAAENYGTIERTYASGAITDPQFITWFSLGGLITNDWGFTADSYWDTDGTGQGWSASGSPLNSVEMTDVFNFANWDFENVWQILSGQAPTLRVNFVVRPTATSETLSLTNPRSDLSITLHASDREGLALDYAITVPPTNGNLSTLNGNELTYTPTGGYSGYTDQFTFTASNAHGTATGVITIDISPSPFAVAFSKDTIRIHSVVLTLNANNPFNETLTYSILSQPSDGDLSDLNGNQVTYTPNGSYSNYTDTFEFQVSDSYGWTTTAVATVNVYGCNQSASGLTHGGNGSPENPYVITTVSELNQMRSNLNCAFILGNDINLSNTSFNPIANFKGDLDGNQHRISNWTYNSAVGGSGFFTTLTESKIKNLGLSNINLSAPATGGGYSQLGGLAGRMTGGSVVNSYITGNISIGTAGGSTFEIGGLIGTVTGGSISKSFSTANLSIGSASGGTRNLGGLIGTLAGASTLDRSYATGNVSAAATIGSIQYLGGLVGATDNTASIADTFATGIVSAGNAGGVKRYFGGLVGGLNYLSNVTRSYSTGAVTPGTAGGGVTNIGGMTATSGGMVTDSYWDTQTSTQSTSAAGTGKTSAQMQLTDTFTNFDFNNVWQEYPGHPPVLRKDFLILTGTSPTNNTTPAITVDGVLNGNTVEIYSGSTCDPATLTGSGTATGPFISIVSSTITADTTYYATQTDMMTGSKSACSIGNFPLVFDNTAPMVAITSPDDNYAITYANQNTITVSGTCSDDHLPITVTITATGTNSGSVSGSAVCTSGTWATTLNLSTLANGGVTISANATDDATNVATQDSHPLNKYSVTPPSKWTNLSTPLSGTTPSARYNPTAVAIGGKFYLYGGAYSASQVYSNLYSYDPATQTWTNLSTPLSGTPAPARYAHVATVIDGKMYVMGGKNSGGSFNNDLHSYDPATQTWTNLTTPSSGTLPSIGYGSTAVTINGKMYVFAGYDGVYNNNLHSYDPATQTWTNLSTPLAGTRPSARYAHTAVEISGKMYVFGGYTAPTFHNHLYSYDPATQTWTNLSTPLSGTPPPARAILGSGVIAGKMYVFGGSYSGGKYNDIYSYEPATQTWSAYPYAVGDVQPVARNAPGMTAINDKLYLYGGYSPSVQLGDLYSYSTSSGDVPDAPTSLTGTSPGNDTTPDITVSGVTSGNEVAIFSEPTCDITSLMGVGTANGSSVTITSSAIFNNTAYYAFQTNLSEGSTSTCSAAHFDYILDTTSPVVSITSPADDFEVTNANVTTFEVSGTCDEANLPIDIVVTIAGENGGSVTDTTTCADGTWTTSLDLTSIVNGAITITADATDGASNPAVQDSVPLSKNTTDVDASASVPRVNQTATVLNNGKVLIVGGEDPTGTYTTSTLLYDPALNTWTAKAPLNAARGYHNAVLLPDGKVLVIGGENNASPLSAVEIYNPTLNTWTTKAPLPEARSYQTATLLNDGKVLVIGGYTEDGSNLTSVYTYDPGSNTWATNTTLPISNLTWHTATLMNNGKVLVVGGLGLSSVFIYDPSLDTWTTKDPLPGVRYLHTATTLSDGTVLIVGGKNNSTVLSSVLLYNPSDDSWTTMAPMNQARNLHVASLMANGKVLIVGGENNSGYLASVEIYNPAINFWTTKDPLSEARSYHTATIMSNGNALIVGGYTNNGYGETEYYDPGLSSPAVTTLVADGNANSFFPSLSANGRYLVFQSYASDLVASDTNSALDVFLYDALTETTSLVSVDSNGAQASGDSSTGSSAKVISADGRYVVFSSNANLAAPTPAQGGTSIFLRDRQTETTSILSIAADGVSAADFGSAEANISANGRYVVFISSATNLVADDHNGKQDVFVRDLQNATTVRVSVASDGTEGNDHSSNIGVISADGRYVAFNSSASNLVENDNNSADDIFLHDLQTHITTRISVDSNGVGGNDYTYMPSISDDGRYIVYMSGATNLVPSDTNGIDDVFLYDRTSGTTTRISVNSAGNEADNGSYTAVISPDGSKVLFGSDASNLVANDTNGFYDIFEYRISDGKVIRVSLTSTGGEMDAISDYPAVSSDGSTIAFHTTATNAVPGLSAINGRYRIYLRR